MEGTVASGKDVYMGSTVKKANPAVSIVFFILRSGLGVGAGAASVRFMTSLRVRERIMARVSIRDEVRMRMRVRVEGTNTKEGSEGKPQANERTVIKGANTAS